MAAGAGPKTKGGHAKRETATPPLAPAGLPAREAAVRLIAAVMHKRHSLDDALAKEFASDALAPRDRALARLIAGTVLRHAGELKALLTSYLEKPPPEPSGKLWPLLAGAAQLCFSRRRRTRLSASPWSKRGSIRGQSDMTGSSTRYCGGFHAKARRCCSDGTRHARIPRLAVCRWSETYGEAEARRRSRSRSLEEAAARPHRARRSGGVGRARGGDRLPTGSVRLAAGGRIEELPAIAEGAWWVQDAAAALPARLLGDVAGRRVADLCAAPGGKTAELAAAGAR